MIQNNAATFGSTPVPYFVPTSVEQRYDIEAAQLEVWLSSQQSVAANCAYNEIATLTLSGSLNRGALEESLQVVYRRHGSLRATFDRHGREVIERAPQSLNIESCDWRAFDCQQIQQLQKQLIDQLGTTPFDLEHGPLFRAILQQESDSQHHLTIVAHHLVLDGWSLGVIVKELGEAYDKIQSGVQPESRQPPQAYADYSRAMQEHANSAAGQRELAYWIEQFQDGVPTLDLPLFGSRSTLRTYVAGRIEHVLPAKLVASLRKLGAKNSCSLVNTTLAAFQAFVARLGQTQDVVLAIPTAGQAALDLPGLVGHCVNTLPLRMRIDDQSTFREHLKLSRSVLLSGMDHQRFSYGTLLKHLKGQRDPSRPPLCAISFNLDPVIKASDIGFTGLAVNVKIEPRAFENFEWFVNGIIHDDQSIELQVQFNRDLFQAEMIAYYMEGFQAYLEYLVEHPEARLYEVPMMSLAQRQAMLVDWNATLLDVPKQSNLPAEFSRQAQATPEKVAVRQGIEQLTYQQLEEQSNRFARFLIQQGVKHGDLVGICTTRRPRLLIQLLGILKAGAGYVPLDPQYPIERLRHMCEDSQLNIIVSESALVETVAAFGKTIVAFEDFERTEAASSESAVNQPQACIAPADVCYVIYTSGSTGKPKGVMVPHGAVINFLYSMKERPGFNSQDNVLAITTLSFDIAVLELYLPLLFGGTVVMADWATATDGKKLMATLDQEQIGLMQATPATWRMMIAAGWSGKADLKVLCGGEPITPDLVASLLPRCRELWNMYGPTETTVWSTASRIESADQPITIGRPIGNTQVYLLDANGQEVPVGVEGELMIGGAGVTLGYWHRPELTSDRFIDNPYFNPFEEYVSNQLYKTGDIAVFRPDGSIEYRRRNDKQIKLRGFRIELGEIESAIMSAAGVTQAVALVRSEPTGDSRLVAYITADRELSIDGLREHVRGLLPHYMIPQNFVVLNVMPLTDNGKVNTKALPAPELATNETEVEPCLSRAEIYLGKIWQAVLQLDAVSRDDNFFDVGGHSLLVMQVINEVESFTGIRLSPQEFLLGTLEQIATQLDECQELDQLELALPYNCEQEQVDAASQAGVVAGVVTDDVTSDTASGRKSPFDCLKRFWR